MYRITKTFGFAASHQLWQLPATHKCARLHGHNYEVTVECSARRLDDDGMVLDYGVLSTTVGQLIKSELDHQCLGCIENEDHAHPLGGAYPTAEVLAVWLWGTIEARATGEVHSARWTEFHRTYWGTIAGATPGGNLAGWTDLWHRLTRVVVKETGGTTAEFVGELFNPGLA